MIFNEVRRKTEYFNQIDNIKKIQILRLSMIIVFSSTSLSRESINIDDDSMSQNVLKSDQKSPRFISFGANLTI